MFFINNKIMSFKFEKLIIWQKAIGFGEEIHLLAETFPKKELYNLTSQITRAADSIALNIAEGSIEQSNGEYKRFLNYAIRSIAEVVTCLYKEKRRDYISEQKFNEMYSKCFELMNMTIAFKAKLK
jgi:four helix bundle protein